MINIRLLAAFAIALLFAPTVFAQNGSRTWNGNTSTDFYDGTNWTAPGDFPNGNVSFNDSSLTGAANTTIVRNNGTYQYVFGLYFQNTLGTDNSYTINGTQQFFMGGSVINTAGVTGGTLTDVINVDFQKAGSAENFNLGANHHLELNGVVKGGGTLTKSGAGTLTFNGANTYSGVTTVNSGILKLGHAGALGATTAGTVVNSGGTLQLNYDGWLGDAITINGTGVGGTGAIHSTDNGIAGQGPDLSGVITLGSDATIRTDTRIDHIGQITDGGNGFTLTKTGASSFVTGQQQNYSNLVVNEGEWLTTGANGLPSGTGTTVTVNTGAQLTVWAAQAPTDVNLTLNDGSIYNANHNVAGTVSSIDGSLSVDGNVTMRSWSNDHTINSDISGTGNITLISYINNFDDAKFTFSGNNTYSGITTVGDADGGNGKMTLELSGTNTGGGNYIINTESSLVVSGTQDQTLSGDISGSGTLLKTNTSTLALTGANTYTGVTTVDAGQLSLEGSLTSDVFVGSGATFATETATVASTTGDINLADGSIGEFTLFGAGGARGTDYSAWDATNFDFDNVTINLIEDTAGLGLTLGYGDAFDLLDWTGNFTLSGTTSFSMLPALATGLRWDTSRWSSDGVIQVVPEPGAAMLLCFGAGAFLLRRKRH